MLKIRVTGQHEERLLRLPFDKQQNRYMQNLNGKKPCISLLTFRKQGKEHVYMTAQKKRQVTADYLRKGEGEFDG